MWSVSRWTVSRVCLEPSLVVCLEVSLCQAPPHTRGRHVRRQATGGEAKGKRARSQDAPLLASTLAVEPQASSTLRLLSALLLYVSSSASTLRLLTRGEETKSSGEVSRSTSVE
jgi:hypothetical protein